MELNFRLDVGGEKLVIGIAQDYETNEILMVAFMNKEAVEQTLKTKKAHYYSTSRQKQWLKGESSGNVQTVKEMYIDCDADAIIMKVEQIGAACHEGYSSYFFGFGIYGTNFCLKLLFFEQKSWKISFVHFKRVFLIL